MTGIKRHFSWSKDGNRSEIEIDAGENLQTVIEDISEANELPLGTTFEYRETPRLSEDK